MNEHDISLIKRMICYCDETDLAISHFGNSFESLKSNVLYRNAAAMCVLQIGELTAHLSEEFKASYNDLPWQDIKGMRNIVAHRYGNIDLNKLWETITEDIPALRKYCIEIINNHI